MSPFSIPFSIHNGYSSVPLSQGMCAQLTRACWLASQEGLDPHLDHWRTLAALFDTLLYRWPVRSAAWPIPPPLQLWPEHDEGSYVWPGHLHTSSDPQTRGTTLFNLELSPGQCAHLARACWFAVEKGAKEEVDQWLPLAIMFQACTSAGLAQWQMSPAQLEALADDLRRLGLGG